MDVVVLATLYVVRVVSGKFLFDVPLSSLFIVFTLFFFFGLALAKRVAELSGTELGTEESVPGRAYRSGDLQVLAAMGAAAASVTALVYSAYAMSEDVQLLYPWPDALWPVLPLLIYWQGRLWLFANRGALHEDPVIFALRDRVSHLTLVATVMCLAVATFGRSLFGG